jgi:hypothetical protein
VSTVELKVLFNHPEAATFLTPLPQRGKSIANPRQATTSE